MESTHRNHRGPLDHGARKLFLFSAGLVILFVAVQFIKLATIGRIGDDISKVKYNQSKTELENEILRMEINSLRSSSNLAQEIQKDETLVKKDVTIISASNSDTTIAQR